jgi:hypothetical protein
VGSRWRTRVTATNASGSASAVSSATPPVTNLAQNVTGALTSTRRERST